VPILGARDLCKAYGDRAILAGASLALEAGERIGLVGRNGTGKSSLARILAGIEPPDSGEVTATRGLRLGYLDQEPELDGAATAIEVALSGLAEWSEAMARHEGISRELSAGRPDTAALIEAQAEVAATIERLGGWDLRHEAKAVLGHLGIAALEQPVATMSGGERRRVAMARLLVSRPDLAIVDEPTNHLDIPTIEWLERYLIDRFAGALVLITHDRHLLDSVVDRTVELDAGVLYSVDGGWEAYLIGKAERIAQGERREANRQNFLRRELEWLRRRPKARTGKQKARIGRAHEALAGGPPRGKGTAAIAVGATRSGKTILEARDLAVDIAGRRLVSDLTLSLTRGERVGIVGQSGTGKTTLLRVLLGDVAPAAGTVVRGESTRIAYLDQSRDRLADGETVLENVAAGRSQIALGDNVMDVRSYLERFLFEGDAQRQRVGDLSGGERARVALARVLSESANLVVLDEPTNDLDVETLGALEAALLDFAGTSLVVTHDRWFLDRVATSIMALEGDGEVVRIAGTYADYAAFAARRAAELAAGQRAAAETAAAAAKPRLKERQPGIKKLTYAERLELESLTETIAETEDRISELERNLRPDRFTELSRGEQETFFQDLAATKGALETLLARWYDLEERNTG
jgi:ATP-binding cassette subfamily F protein uup